MEEQKKAGELTYRVFNRRLFHTVRLHHTLAERVLSTLDVHRAQHMLLMRLAHEGEPPSQRELAEHLEVSPAAVTVALKKLEAGGYISRKSSQSDSRTNRTHITERGMRVVTESRERFEEIDRQMFKGVAPEELESCFATLALIEENLKAALAEYETGKEEDI